jgi:hypothetical protein
MNCQSFPRLLKVGVKLTLLVALLAFVARAASAQQPSSDSTIQLSLGDAVRLAARQNVSVESAFASMPRRRASPRSALTSCRTCPPPPGRGDPR